MSWAIEASGSAEEIGKSFDETRESSASYGMVEDEQRDIDDARDLAMTLAEKYGRVRVSASGHWNSNDGKSDFARCSVTVTAGAS